MLLQSLPILADAATAITSDSTIPIGMMWLIVAGVASGAFAAGGIYFQIKGLRREFRSSIRNGWTIQDQQYWTLRFGSDNPNLKMHDPVKIGARDK